MTPAATVVTLRKGFPIESAGNLWTWLNSPREANFDDFGPELYADFLNRLRSRLQTETSWAVVVDGEPVGYLGFMPQSPMAGQFHGLVIAPEYRRRGLASFAVRSALTELAAEGFSSFLVITFADNLTIQKILKRAGFKESGYLHCASRRDGKPLGMRVMHAISESAG